MAKLILRIRGKQKYAYGGWRSRDQRGVTTAKTSNHNIRGEGNLIAASTFNHKREKRKPKFPANQTGVRFFYSPMTDTGMDGGVCVNLYMIVGLPHR